MKNSVNIHTFTLGLMTALIIFLVPVEVLAQTGDQQTQLKVCPKCGERWPALLTQCPTDYTTLVNLVAEKSDSPPGVNEPSLPRNERLVSLGVSVAFHAGYASLGMDDVNGDLQNWVSEFRTAGASVNEPETIDGGLFFDGSVALRLNWFLVGCSLGSISSSGSLTYADNSGSFSLTYETTTFEAVPFIGVRIPLSRILNLDLAGGAGYGKATADYRLTLSVVRTPSDNLNITQTVNGPYLAGRLEGMVKLVMDRVSIDAGVMYRWADAGPVKGKQTANGQETKGEYAIPGLKNNEVGIDFSGVVIRGGVSIEF